MHTIDTVTVLAGSAATPTVRLRSTVRAEEVVLLDRASAVVDGARAIVDAWIKLSQADPCGTMGNGRGSFALAEASTALKFEVLRAEYKLETPDGSEERIAFAALVAEARTLLATLQAAQDAAEKVRIEREMRSLAEERGGEQP